MASRSPQGAMHLYAIKVTPGLVHPRNLEYPDLLGTSKYIMMHVQKVWLMIFFVCGDRLSDELASFTDLPWLTSAFVGHDNFTNRS